MKGDLRSQLAHLAVYGLYVQGAIGDVSPYFRSEAYAQGQLGAWPHQTYKSSPALGPILNIQKNHPTCQESPDHLILLAPWGSEVTQPGPMILDPQGHLVWNEPTKYGKTWALDVRIFNHEPYLSFWADKNQGTENGAWYLLNSTYDEVHSIRPGNGWITDDHDLDLTVKGTAVLMVNLEIPFDLRPVGGPKNGWLRDNGFQEVDVETGEVLFQWSAAHHWELWEGYHRFPEGWGQDPEHAFDAFVMNSVHMDQHGNYLASSRHMSSIVYIDGQTGDVLWKLGGKLNDFTDLSPGGTHNATVFNGQHHARLLDMPGTSSSNTLLMTIFDNGFGAQDEAHPTSGKIIELDVAQKTARLLHAPYQHPDRWIMTESRGSLQLLPNGNRLLGYGAVAAWAEFSPEGQMLCDVHFAPESRFNTEEAFSYRVLKKPWVGQPRDGPSAVILEDGRLYASWNGATEVTSWELQALPYHSGHRREETFLSLGSTDKSGFETAIQLPEELDINYYRVVGRSRQGEALGVSELVRGLALTLKPALVVQP